MTDDAQTLTFAELCDRVQAALEANGFCVAQAAALARVVAAAERDGARSHGLYRLDGMIASARAGVVDPKAEPTLLPDDGTAIVRVNANFGFAPAALELGAPVLAERARALGIAALVVNDCGHLSALWPEVEMLTSEGLAAIALCPSYSTVAPAGGTAPLLGTNPFAFGWPRPGGDPYVFDIATSVAARGEIELHRRAGTPIPEGWAIDSDGLPTTDPASALAGAMLPFGGHKGSALGTMIELLGACLIGDLTSRGCLDRIKTTALSPIHGELLIAFSPEVFSCGRDGDPFARAEDLFGAILGQGARLPSQRRFTARAQSLATGIELPSESVKRLGAMRSLKPEA